MTITRMCDAMGACQEIQLPEDEGMTASSDAVLADAPPANYQQPEPASPSSPTHRQLPREVFIAVELAAAAGVAYLAARFLPGVMQLPSKPNDIFDAAKTVTQRASGAIAYTATISTAVASTAAVMGDSSVSSAVVGGIAGCGIGAYVGANQQVMASMFHCASVGAWAVGLGPEGPLPAYLTCMAGAAGWGALQGGIMGAVAGYGIGAAGGAAIESSR